MNRVRRRVEYRIFDIGSHRRMIEWERRPIQTLPVSLETIDVDILSILQLKFDQMNMYRMCIFREVLEVPRLCRGQPGNLGNIRIEMLSVDQNRHWIAGIALLLIQCEELWIPDAFSFNKCRNGNQRSGQMMRVHGRRVEHFELHNRTSSVGINWITAGEWRIGCVLQDDFRPCGHV